ncbi:Transcription factor bHLH [Abeliophyllum distichum]|uniref:Transcription factor n=1 Tax=Abeliophyllum distichum TaxID=126358 RepID=A0ABD1TEV0_9LAMI
MDVLTGFQEAAKLKMMEALADSKHSPELDCQFVVERAQKRDADNQFYELWLVVPYVSKMNKASLLSDAVSYIKELKAKVEEFESKRMKMESSEDDQERVQLEIEVKIVALTISCFKMLWLLVRFPVDGYSQVTMH